MHFPPISDFLPISENLSDSVKHFPNFTFSKKVLMTFLVVESKFRIPSYFRCFHTFPTISENFLFSPYFSNSPLILLNLLVFTYILDFLFPHYFDHDAFMHHTMHVLDAPENISRPLHTHIYSVF